MVPSTSAMRPLLEVGRERHAAGPPHRRHLRDQPGQERPGGRGGADGPHGARVTAPTAPSGEMSAAFSQVDAVTSSESWARTPASASAATSVPEPLAHRRPGRSPTTTRGGAPTCRCGPARRPRRRPR